MACQETEAEIKGVRVHLYNVENVLRPRGHMKKESIGLYIKEKLHDAYESWSDPECGDSIDPEKLMELLHKNLTEEVNGAFRDFIAERCGNEKDREIIKNIIKQYFR